MKETNEYKVGFFLASASTEEMKAAALDFLIETSKLYGDVVNTEEFKRGVESGRKEYIKSNNK